MSRRLNIDRVELKGIIDPPVGRDIPNPDMNGRKIGWVYKELAENGEYHPIQDLEPERRAGGTTQQPERRAGGTAHQDLSEEEQIRLARALSLSVQPERRAGGTAHQDLSEEEQLRIAIERSLA